MIIDYAVKISILAFSTVEHTCSTEHFFTGNTLLITSLLDKITESLPDSVRCLNALDLKYGSRLISCCKGNGTYTEDLLPECLLELQIQDSVEKDFFGMRKESTSSMHLSMQINMRPKNSNCITTITTHPCPGS